MFRILFLRMTAVLITAIVFGVLAGCAKGERRADETSVPAANMTDSVNMTDSATVSDSTAATTQVTIRGAITYRERMALPPDARALVELREGSVEGPLKAEKWIGIDGKEVPLPFEFTVSRERLSPNKTYHARGAIFAAGLPAWVSEVVDVNVSQGDAVDLGTITMSRPAPGAFKSSMQCGDEKVVVGFSKTAMLLTVGGQTYELKPSPSASGTKYEAVGDPSTTFWNKGENTTITVKGRTLPECGRITAAPAAEDTASTVPANLPAAGTRALAGKEWVVQNIAGKKLVAKSRVTLNFSDDGKLGGKASCNSYSAEYTLSGDTISISQPVATMMMCDGLMDQEKSFLDLLQKANRFEIASDGSLVLHTSDGRQLTAKR
jgi:heat shock protein HslJ/uncharacterized lipoprotein YbaY